MKIILLALLVLSLALTGCSRSSAQAGDAPAAVPAASYKAQRGIQLSPVALRELAVETREVSGGLVGVAKADAAIPRGALLRTVKGDFVYVANGGWFMRTPVVIGALDRSWVEIKEGLYEGDRVVTRGTRALWLTELQATNGGVGCADDN